VIFLTLSGGDIVLVTQGVDMEWFDLLAWEAAAISLWGTGKYMVSIAKGETQPRLASWIAWAAANGILMAVALMNDATTAAVFNGIAALGNIGVLVISGIKRAGQRPSGSTDWACLSVAGLCLVAILVFANMTALVAVLAMCANLIATWPTMQHAWRRPREEAWQLFAANGTANGLGLVSVIAASGMNIGSIAGPLISMTGNLILVAITAGCNWLLKIADELEADAREIKEALEPQTNMADAE
jgi:hypothetical protein